MVCCVTLFFLIKNKIGLTTQMDFSLKPYRFLIVDDFGSYRTSLLTMLTEAGVPSEQIDSAASGEEALSLLRENSYDIILCDFYMGDGKDGQQVLEESRSLGILGYATVFIMITAETARAMVLSVVENRPDDYLTKPFTQAVLSSRLKRLLADKEGLESVDQALEQKSHKRAIHYLDTMIEARGGGAFELLRIKSEILEKNRYFEESLKIYEQTLEQQSLLWAQLGRGRVLFQLKQFEEALGCFEAVLEENDAHNVARDWMARTLMELGQGGRAQEILQEAVEQSPRVLKRQKLLATVAQKNGDMGAAQKAFENTVRLGEHSLFRDVSDFTGLSDVLMGQKASQKALNVLKKAKKSFASDASALVETSLQENAAYTQLGKPNEAAKALQKATENFEKRNRAVDADVALKLASKLTEETRKVEGEAEEAEGMLAEALKQKSHKKREQNKDLVKDILSEVTQQNHNNVEVQQQIETLAAESDMSDEERKQLNSARQEVLNLNSDGVSLYKQGKMVEAAEILFTAAERLEGNRVINLNAAQALLGVIIKKGVTQELINQTDACLSRIPPEDHDDKYKKMHDLFERFVQKLG